MPADPSDEITIGRWGRWSIRIMPGACYQRGEPIAGAALVYDPEASFTWFPLGETTQEWFEFYLSRKLRVRPGSHDGLDDALRAARALVEGTR